jgi:hypothetical protein
MNAAQLKAMARPIYAPLVDSDFGRKVAKNRWRFNRVMRNYFSDHCTATPPTTRDPNLRALIENGFVVLPAYHGRERVQAVHDRAFPMLERIRRGDIPADWRTIDYSEDGIYRLLEAGRHFPEAATILKDAYVHSLVAGYYAPKPFKEVSNYVDYKPDLVHDHTSVLHMDSPMSQIKIFTLLCNVGPHNAPLVYWSKSHYDAPWRRRFDYEFWTGDEVGTTGAFPASMLRKLRAQGGERAPQEVMVTGPAGTVVIADTRGVHRASNLIEGYRLELVQKFIH